MPALQTEDRLILQLYDHLPDAVVWHTPVFSGDGDVEDFLVQYCNQALCRNLNLTREELIGSRLRGTRFADRQNIEQIYTQCKSVYETGETLDVSYYSPLYDRFFHVTRIRVLHGVLNVIRDRTHEWKLEVEKQEQNALTAQIVNASPTCVVLCQALRQNNVVDDFLILSVNDKIAKDMARPKSEIEGKTYCELLPAVRTNGYLDMLTDVVTTGKPFRGEMLLECFGGWQFVSAEKVQADKVVAICLDITETKQAAKNLQRMNEELEGIFNSALTGICSLTAIRHEDGTVVDFVYEKVNQRFEDITHLKSADVVGKRHSQVYPHARETGFFDRMCEVVYTKQPVKIETAYNHDGLSGWFESSMSAMGTDGLVVSFDDVTERKNHLSEIEQKRNLLDNLLTFSPSGISIVKALRDEKGHVVDFQNVLLNDKAAQFTGLPKDVLLAKSNLQIEPAFATSPAFQMLAATLETGEPCYTDYRVQSTGKWIEGAVSRMNENHLICVVTDATESREIQRQLEHQKNLLNNILQNSPAAISVVRFLKNDAGETVDAQTILINDIAEKFTGIPNETSLTKKVSEIVPGIEQSDLFQKTVAVQTSGETLSVQYYLEQTGRWLELSVARLDDEHVINVFTDITASKEAQLAVERSAGSLKKAIDAAQTGMFLFRPVRDGNGEVVDFRFDIVNATVAAYVNESPETLEGRLGTDFFPNYKASGVFDMYRQSLETGQTLRKEVHYNVDGHDNYLDVQSTRVEDTVLVTFTDHTPIRRAQVQLERLVEELRRSNTNLEEFAYAASHDLKEPIRKIHFFSDRLVTEHGHLFNEDGKRLFGKLRNATDRMRTLVEDLLAYSQVSLRPKSFDEVDLAALIRAVIDDLELEIEEKKGTVNFGRLPVVSGHQRQLQQLFVNLLGNALKYSKHDVPPVIELQCSKVKGHESGLNVLYEDRRKEFYCIEVKDNGIGFDQKDADKIFQVFQRLHGASEYRGTGVGLSIGRKVVENHNGYIEAQGQESVGATFRILLPV